MGVYHKRSDIGEVNGRPVWQHQDGTEKYLFYSSDNNRNQVENSRWSIGNDYGYFNCWIKTVSQNLKQLPKNGWMYYPKRGWTLDKMLTVTGESLNNRV